MTNPENILLYIKWFISEKGIPPTRREIMTACELSSTSVASEKLEMLERIGAIRLIPGVARGIVVIRQNNGFGHKGAIDNVNSEESEGLANSNRV